MSLGHNMYFKVFVHKIIQNDNYKQLSLYDWGLTFDSVARQRSCQIVLRGVVNNNKQFCWECELIKISVNSHFKKYTLIILYIGGKNPQSTRSMRYGPK